MRAVIVQTDVTNVSIIEYSQRLTLNLSGRSYQKVLPHATGGQHVTYRAINIYIFRYARKL